ncbi:MAG: SGNH hydrolase domain-containing protein, partial [Burkholderiaceae bacterium]
GQSLLLGRPAPEPPRAAAVAARNSGTDAVFAALASRPGVVFVALAPVLCTPVCAVTDAGGRPAYIDDDHLSRAGAIGLLAGPVHDAIWGRAARATAHD